MSPPWNTEELSPGLDCSQPRHRGLTWGSDLPPSMTPAKRRPTRRSDVACATAQPRQSCLRCGQSSMICFNSVQTFSYFIHWRCDILSCESSQSEQLLTFLSFRHGGLERFDGGERFAPSALLLCASTSSMVALCPTFRARIYQTLLYCWSRHSKSRADGANRSPPSKLFKATVTEGQSQKLFALAALARKYVATPMDPNGLNVCRR